MQVLLTEGCDEALVKTQFVQEDLEESANEKIKIKDIKRYLASHGHRS